MSIQKIQRLFVVLALLLVFVAMPVMAQLKVGYVDTQYIMAKYQGSIDIAKQLESERAVIASELQTMEKDLVDRQKKLEQQSLMLSEEKKRQQYEELQTLYQQLQQQAQVKDQEFNKRRDELLGPIVEEVDTAIKNVGDENGYDFVLKSEALLFAKDSINITEKVLEELQKDKGTATK
ncbi:OmpH family outer membrane protein [bacterium]|nr:OmpH family outer membrane protein [bacterium]